MEFQGAFDRGEEIIKRLKEFNLLLQEKLREIENEKQCKNLFSDKQ
jgi:hypothetical protein